MANKLIAIGIMILGVGCDAMEATEDIGVNEDAIGLSGTLAYGPAAVRVTPGTVDVFAPGTDFTIYTRRFTEATKSWSGWVQVEGAGVVGSGLAAVKDAAGGVKIFAVNRSLAFGAISTIGLAWSGSAWTVASGWRTLSYGSWVTENAPGATVDPNGIIHVFSRDAATNNLIHTSCGTPASCNSAAPAWTAWDNTDQVLPIYSTPAVVSRMPGEFDLYFKGKDDRLREARYRFAGPPFSTNTWSVSDTGETLYMWSYETSFVTSPDYTVASAVAVDTSQGAHRLHNVVTNPAVTSSTSGSCGGAGSEAVMKLVLPQDARVQIDTFGADYDTVLYVRSADGVTQVKDKYGVTACNDDSGGTVQSALDLRLAAQTYYIFLDGYYLSSASANKRPQINVSISYFNAPAAVVRGSAIDLYSINTDNRLYLTSRFPGGFNSWSLINGPDPFGDGGDYQNSAGLSATLNGAGTCSYVFARSFPWRNLIEKGCGETASFSLDNGAGGVFTSSWTDPVPSFTANPYDASWGPVNTAWNQTVNFGGAGSSSGWTGVYLTAKWPTELYMFDFDDYKTTGAGAWDLAAPHGYANVLGFRQSTTGGLGFEADHGAELVAKNTWMPGGVKSARLIDHGSCATRIPWVDREYGNPNTKGLLNQLQMQFNNTLYDQTSRSLWNAGIDLGTFEWQVNRIEPTFTHFAWDGLTGIHSDGFAFQNHLHRYGGGKEIWVVADAHYTLGLEQGVPHIYPLTTHGSIDRSGFTWTIVGLVFDWIFTGFQNATVNDYIKNSLMAHGLPLCEAGAIDCSLQHDFPATFADTVRAQMTTMIGDPMAYATCSVTADCPGGKGLVCNSGRCLVPITPGMPGYLASFPSTNFRTEFDWLDNAPGHLDSISCTPITPGLTMTTDNGLAGCQALLSKLLQSKGLTAAAADNLAYQSRGGAHDYQYGCVRPQRPQCGGDGSFSGSTGYSGGYFCRANDVAAGTAGTGVIPSRCTWRPAFKRLNVLPTSLELVWSEAGAAASADEQIVKLLAPSQACSDPATTEIDLSATTALPRLVHEGPL